MRGLKRVIQTVCLFSLSATGLLINTERADEKVIAIGYTQLTFPGLEGNEGMRRHSYTWSQERVGKTTYHTVFFKSTYRDDQRQFTSVLIFKIDSKGVQKQVRNYLFRVDGDKPEAFLIRTKTSSPGTYFYNVRSESVFHDDIQGPAYTETMHVLVK